MGYQSKTYSLSDEVVEAIETARACGETPNQFLRRKLLGLPSNTLTRTADMVSELRAAESSVPVLHENPSDLDAVGPEIASGRGKASTEIFKRAVRQKGDKAR